MKPSHLFAFSSNPLKKVLNVSGSTVASSQNMRYLYGGSKPNAVMEMSDNNSTMICHMPYGVMQVDGHSTTYVFLQAILEYF